LFKRKWPLPVASSIHLLSVKTARKSNLLNLNLIVGTAFHFNQKIHAIVMGCSTHVADSACLCAGVEIILAMKRL
jgi:hypothetical protein